LSVQVSRNRSRQRGRYECRVYPKDWMGGEIWEGSKHRENLQKKKCGDMGRRKDKKDVVRGNIPHHQPERRKSTFGKARPEFRWVRSM